MKTIGLIQISQKRQGGVIYRNQVIESLRDNFNIQSVDLSAKYRKSGPFKILESIFYLLRLKGGKDLWVRDFFSTSFLTKKTKGKNLALFFHVDFSGFPFLARFALTMIEKIIFYRKLRKVNIIVTISEYWKNFFLKKGFKNVYKVYCGFDVENFNIKDEEVEDFKRKHNLIGKPIIYIGNCQKPKGVVETYRALKDLDSFLVASGRKEVNIPILTLDLDYRNYLKLLKASSIAITMSKFKEGWCMTAHEAMLVKTPVIGSGLGGMKELLERGGQIICNDFKDLKKKVEYLLDNPEERKKIGGIGFNYAKNFTLEKFQQEWQNLISKIL